MRAFRHRPGQRLARRPARIRPATRAERPPKRWQRGADIVTFSGDKLLGGRKPASSSGAPISLRRSAQSAQRALRVDKLTVAALAAVLRLYSDPQRLVRRLPTLRMLQRTTADIAAAAQTHAPACARHSRESQPSTWSPVTARSVAERNRCGALASAGLAIRPEGAKRRGTALKGLAAAFRRLPLPVVGRIHDGALILDLRALEDEGGLRRAVAVASDRYRVRP